MTTETSETMETSETSGPVNVRKGSSRYYMDRPASSEVPKYPVGKVAGIDSHSYNGSSIMHVLKKDENDEWVLLCKPSKKGIYNYMGFRQVIACQTCMKFRDKR